MFPVKLSYGIHSISKLIIGFLLSKINLHSIFQWVITFCQQSLWFFFLVGSDHYDNLSISRIFAINSSCDGGLFFNKCIVHGSEQKRSSFKVLFVYLRSPFFPCIEATLYMEISRWAISNSDWLYSLQPKMEKLYTVSKNKTWSWLWLWSSASHSKIQA